MAHEPHLQSLAEWNKPKDREAHLHRHPAFFGHAEDVFEDCCGYCPKPSTPEEEEVAVTESKIYVSGPISFLKDDAGRQSIGSFNPITDSEWATAYVGNTAVSLPIQHWLQIRSFMLCLTPINFWQSCGNINLSTLFSVSTLRTRIVLILASPTDLMPGNRGPRPRTC